MEGRREAKGVGIEGCLATNLSSGEAEKGNEKGGSKGLEKLGIKKLLTKLVRVRG